jgi:putative membrane protein
MEILVEHYEWLRALHIISVIAWMAGMLYLPRLFVYHAQSGIQPETSQTFKTMERRLLKYIMTPAMIAAWIFGLSMLAANPEMLKGAGWMHAKLLLVVLMSGLHGYFAKTVRVFANDQNQRSPNFYRILNEIPTLLMIVIVILAVVQPF